MRVALQARSSYLKPAVFTHERFGSLQTLCEESTDLRRWCKGEGARGDLLAAHDVNNAALTTAHIDHLHEVAAEDGDHRIVFELAQRYTKGKKGAAQNLDKAEGYYRALSDRDESRYWYYLGKFLFENRSDAGVGWVKAGMNWLPGVRFLNPAEKEAYQCYYLASHMDGFPLEESAAMDELQFMRNWVPGVTQWALERAVQKDHPRLFTELIA